MTRRIRKTSHAKSDIRSIAQWIAQGGVDAALRWIDELDAKLQKLLEMPGSGTDRSELWPDMRSSPFGNYLVFFKPTPDGITVMRVLHGARDYARFFRRQ